MQDKLVFEGPIKLKVQVFDKDFEMTKPSIGQQSDYESKLKSCKEDGEVVRVMLDHLSDLGLDKEYARKLHLSQISELLSTLTGSGKKK